MKKLYLILALFLVTLPAAAQRQVFPENIEYAAVASRAGSFLNIDIDILMDNVFIARQGMVVFTPVLLTESQNEIYLAPAVIAGPKRMKFIRRLLAYGNPVFSQEPLIMAVRNNRSAQKVSLSYSIPYQDWMPGADLLIYGDASGCGKCGHAVVKYMIQEDIVPNIPPVFTPDYRISYIVPEAEVKELRETFAARINYHVGRYEILPEYRNNAAVLKEVDDIIMRLKNDPDLTITRKMVTGYASPEGNFESNMTLSYNRARAFMNFLQQKYGWDPSDISYAGKGEDWEGLRAAVVATPDLPMRDEVLRIIDNTSNITQRKRALESLGGGSVYRIMLRDLYPPLRRNDFEISYIARPFNVDEARALVRTRPQLLNLNEMFLVAKSYPSGSPEFKEVFDIAVRMYPDNPVSRVNAAAMEIETGSNERAIERLAGIESAEALNNLGIANARLGKYDLARQYFRRAIQAGDSNATNNLNQMERSIENQGLRNN